MLLQQTIINITSNIFIIFGILTLLQHSLYLLKLQVHYSNNTCNNNTCNNNNNKKYNYYLLLIFICWRLLCGDARPQTLSILLPLSSITSTILSSTTSSITITRTTNNNSYSLIIFSYIYNLFNKILCMDNNNNNNNQQQQQPLILRSRL
eukprot:UN02617